MKFYYKPLLLLCFSFSLVFTFIAPALAANYTIQPGDSLFSISLQYQTSVRNLMCVNQLTSPDIKPGQQLTVPDKTDSVKPYIQNYSVLPGDNLYQLAMNFNTTTQILLAANNLSNTVIYPSQVLMVPGKEEKKEETMPIAPSIVSRGSIDRDRYQAISDADLNLLARLVSAESGGEGKTCKISVAAVVLNRVKSSLFPNTIRDVIYQPSQFSPAHNGRIDCAAPKNCYEATQKALAGTDPTKGALYFFDCNTSNRQLRSLPVAAVYGNIIFAYR